MNPATCLRHSALLTLALAPVAAAQGDCFVDTILPPVPGSGQAIGSAIDADGLRAIAGSPDTLEAFVYRFDYPANRWVHEATLTGSGVAAGEGFATSVAIAGDYAAVGAPGRDALGSDSGSAFVFERSGGSWSQVAELVPFDGKPLDRFGHCLALDGERLVVGAPYHDGGVGLADAGVAYPYLRAGGTWTQTGRFAADTPVAGGLFGWAVDVSGDAFVVGAPAQNWDTGAVYHLELLPGGALAQTVLFYSIRAGRVVAIDGERVAFAFLQEGYHGILDASVGARMRTSGGWSWIFYLDPEVVGSTPSDAIDIQGERIAYSHDTGSSGDAYVHVRVDGELVTSYSVPTPVGLGASIAFAQGQLLAGATMQVDPGTGTVGAVLAWRTAPGDCATRYCFGAGCPCGNDGANGCTNSTGQSGVLDTLDGGPSVSDDTWRLIGTGLPPGQPGMLYMGPGQVSLPFSDGLRCVGAGGVGTFRFQPQTAVGGTLVYGPDLVALSCASGGAAGCIQPGSSWNFQVWYRDPSGPCGGGSNLTNGLAATFAP